jgi:hypothetical protein
MDTKDRIEDLHYKVKNLKDPQSRLDMYTLLNNIKKQQVKISQEMVECRRRQRPTTRYLELEEECKKMLSECEKLLSFALLLHG